MELANRLLDYFAGLTITEAAFWLLIQNIIQFALCLGGGIILTKLFARHRIFSPPEPLTAIEIKLAATCVIFNTLVAVAGWLLWKQGIITISREIGIRCLLDVLILVLLMDFLMYVTHRLVHIKGIFEYVHKTHHQFEMTRPLSLFVLNPLEVIGFGTLWLFVICLYQSTWLGIIGYLLLNAAFGALGHTGVEPFPKQWTKIPGLREITTSTFHAQHHQDLTGNFGFYTSIWDRLFNSLNDKYFAVFTRAASGLATDYSNAAEYSNEVD